MSGPAPTDTPHLIRAMHLYWSTHQCSNALTWDLHTLQLSAEKLLLCFIVSSCERFIGTRT